MLLITNHISNDGSTTKIRNKLAKQVEDIELMIEFLRQELEQGICTTTLSLGRKVAYSNALKGKKAAVSQANSSVFGDAIMEGLQRCHLQNHVE